MSEFSDEEILAGITDVAREHLGWDGALTPEMRLAEEMRLDSLKILTLAVEVENLFRICIDPTMDGQIVTVGDLVEAIRSSCGKDSQ
jgi:acyl carrier protein